MYATESCICCFRISASMSISTSAKNMFERMEMASDILELAQSSVSFFLDNFNEQTGFNVDVTVQCHHV